MSRNCSSASGNSSIRSPRKHADRETRGSRPAAALISYQDYLRLQEMNENEVLARFDQVWDRLGEWNSSCSPEAISADIEKAWEG